MRKRYPIKHLIFIFLIGLTVLWAIPTPLPAEETVTEDTTSDAAPLLPDQSSYLIGPGDILDISVWKEAALTKRTVVLPDGFITFPLIGAVKAQGHTVHEIQKVIEEKLTRFIPRPNLSVSVEQINSLYVYIIGKVNRSGRFELNHEVTVLQALALAGGLNPFAKKDKIRIFRKEAANTVIFDFDYSAVSRGRQLEKNISLKRGDVVVVP